MATRLGSPQNVSKSGDEDTDDCPSLESNSSRLARKESPALNNNYNYHYYYYYYYYYYYTTATNTTIEKL